ncbi:sigma-54-dependent transcriptional regulator [Alkalicoccus luteus]|uniref:Sigma-54-dependent Fis family transcriptional regulator n=1 Tax=Alkalicoccus luteus TaxID=1237094 RepID=A0A969TTE6_9BACI|nr:sigma-54 dependent transcriptional regulator [Alkalicoccus luteus]NJP36175.1 sigma-54-dependent Fis family transcriptional regulator [Alkalicoccus luteus]
MTESILIVDDEKEVGTFLHYLLRPRPYKVLSCTNGEQAEQVLHQNPLKLALIDIRLPDTNGLDLLLHIKKAQPTCKTVIMTGYATIDTAVEAIKRGADDFIEKPFAELDELERQLDRFLASDSGETKDAVIENARQAGAIIGRDKQTVQLFRLAQKLASKSVTLMLNGETGTGKEVLARFIHQESERSSAPFTAINCGALSETLLESELFGHVKGAFTGAHSDRKGLFEVAADGTLFLDEIAEASPAIQVKLLRVLETREFMQVGGEKTRKTRARIIAATHKNLLQEVQEKRFREDLYYRLHVIHMTLPPLRDRMDDLPLIAAHMMEELNPALSISTKALLLLQTYEWPGNMRELQNVLTRAVLSMEDTSVEVEPRHLQLPVSQTLNHAAETKEPASFPDTVKELTNHLLSLYEQEELPALEDILKISREIERTAGAAFADKALQKARGSRTNAASLLKTTPRKLRYIVHEK